MRSNPPNGTHATTACQAQGIDLRCFRTKTQPCDCVLIVKGERNSYLFALLITRGAVLQLFVRHSRSFEQVSDFSEFVVEGHASIFFSVLIQQLQGYPPVPVVWLFRVNLDFSPKNCCQFDCHKK